MSAPHPIPAVVEKVGDHAVIVAGFRPSGQAFGRRSGWINAAYAYEPQVSVTTLRRLRDQGFTKVRVEGSRSLRCPSCGGDAELGPTIDQITCFFCGYAGPKRTTATFTIEELLA